MREPDFSPELVAFVMQRMRKEGVLVCHIMIYMIYMSDYIVAREPVLKLAAFVMQRMRKEGVLVCHIMIFTHHTMSVCCSVSLITDC